MQTKSTKGKTWEEIYGKEYAEIKRQKLKEQMSAKHTNKGKKWEDIYTPEEVARRRERMKHNNPIHKMSEETKKERSKKLSDKCKAYYKTHDNPMQGRHHTEETKALQSQLKKDLFETAYIEKHRAIAKVRSINYRALHSVTFTCAHCGQNFECLPSFVNYKAKRIRKFCSPDCQHTYARLHPHIKYTPNSWERFIIDLNIPDIKFTGDFNFWITLHFKNKLYHKNPDFIITDFSKTHAVIEVLGKRFHDVYEIEELSKAYTAANIKHLFLTNKDFIKANLNATISKIKEFVKYAIM